MNQLSRRRAALLIAAWITAMHVPLHASAATTPRVLVAFGDSITEGAGAVKENGKPVNYPDRLAARLGALPGGAGATVINAGIAGNRLLADGVGPKGISRFEHDVLAQPGITHVVILIGINDIGFSMPEGASEPIRGQPPAEELIVGLQALIQQAQVRGVKVLLGTLPPFKGASYWSKEKESRRDVVNRWIRTRRNVDAVIDFDAAMRDPADPEALKPAYDSGDHLHPGNAGYAAMADAIDLQALRK